MSKGSKPRPVNKAKYDSNFDSIDWTPKHWYVFLGRRPIGSDSKPKYLSEARAAQIEYDYNDNSGLDCKAHRFDTEEEAMEFARKTQRTNIEKLNKMFDNPKGRVLIG